MFDLVSISIFFFVDQFGRFYCFLLSFLPLYFLCDDGSLMILL